MKSGIAILTFNRLENLKITIEGIKNHCPDTPVAIFDDFGCRDGTSAWLTQDAVNLGYNQELEAVEFNRPDGIQVFLGTRNLGVSGNSNRAIRWFEKSNLDHLLLCNDDIVVNGDFTKTYANGHQVLGTDLLMLCDFPEEMYQCTVFEAHGIQVKMLSRLTGIMMSMTRRLVEKIGYFDIRFGKFGNEHVCYTHRARLDGMTSVDGIPHGGLDIVQTDLTHQICPSSIPPSLKPYLDQEADIAMKEATSRYRISSHYRPFYLDYPKTAGGAERLGIRTDNLLEMGYTLLSDRVG